MIILVIICVLRMCALFLGLQETVNSTVGYKIEDFAGYKKWFGMYNNPRELEEIGARDAVPGVPPDDLACSDRLAEYLDVSSWMHHFQHVTLPLPRSRFLFSGSYQNRHFLVSWRQICVYICRKRPRERGRENWDYLRILFIASFGSKRDKILACRKRKMSL